MSHNFCPGKTFTLIAATRFLMETFKPLAVTRAVSKILAVEHHPRLIYYNASASNEPYFNIQMTIVTFARRRVTQFFLKNVSELLSAQLINSTTATQVQNGEMKKQSQNGGTWLANYVMSANPLISQLQNVLLL